MRITNNMMTQDLLRNLQASQGRMSQIQNQMSSGYRITRPSDDPVGIQNALRMKSSISAVEQWKSNADEALGLMDTTDGTLGDMTSMLQRVKELAVQASNGTLSESDRESIAIEVDQIFEQLRLVANTKNGSRYIFSGTATDKELITKDPVTSEFVWQGNNEDVKFEVGNNLSLPISVNGQTLFKEPLTGAAGVFDTLSALSTALRDNNSAAIEDSLKDIEGNIDNVLAHRANIGARTNRMTALREQLDTTSYNLIQNLSAIQDADIAKTIIEFKNSENVYKASLSVGAQIIQPSLVDFMR
ncbi:MAG: flagellar hook-associated protein FlgL [Desulfosporosinus sp.]|nr:flagellar hook-associated protein FlgL [Desulfosporosinus sp.]MBC2723262.1 flagellar hook-associated protein FlgL [Desulfosporosinus sp.]MBC2727466.1 flagellar hook-associated protein FlgL [Desulfosporosinus sp.]